MANAVGPGFIGQIGEYFPKREEYGNYVRRFQIWKKANKIPEGDEVIVFLAIVKPESFETVSNHFCPDDPSTKTFKELNEVLDTYYGSSKNQIALRLAFRQCRQGAKDSITEYILELKKLARHCGYGEHLDTNLRDTFVAGLRNNKVQAKLLAKGNELTWKVAVDAAIAMELADADSLKLQQGSSSGQRSAEVHRLERSQPRAPQQESTCYRCLGFHLPATCPHRQTTCYSCRKVGHLKRACRNATSSSSYSKGRGKPWNASRGQSNEPSQGRGRGPGPGRGRGYSQQSTSQGKKDSRSNTHLIDTEVQDDNPKLFAVDEQDTSMDSDSVPIVEFDISDHVVPFVVDTAVADSLEVVEELDRLGKAGVIRKVKNSRWAAPIVTVPKSDGSVRLCGDYKQTVNTVLEEDVYPLATCEDLFANLAGGKVFSKIDLSNAYLQLELTDKSKELLTIHTHKGLYEYERLPFGVSTAPAVFQIVMDRILGGMKGVFCYLDDILISSENEEDHIKTLNEVLGRLEEYGVKAKKEKCSFMVSRVIYLGHEIDSKGVHPTKEKVEGICDAKRPENKDELRTFIGIVVYNAKFVPNLASTFASLYQLLRDDVEWNWTTECQTAFDRVK
ncbi:uncharacterized protein LOC115927898 [Strongylocentrotus purpuratus]|uniref:Reverse transcriptase domain-containing protein n=1 Tax=Strongylocentrotus purpuratus TaxID=7668 RepID=A0A7M7PFW1_STRPU|nr:uncharacterized protein LOC115927898 [Strongylocentrotus purpuratus]